MRAPTDVDQTDVDPTDVTRTGFNRTDVTTTGHAGIAEKGIADEGTNDTRPSPTLATFFGVAAVLVGIGIGAQRLGDNSFLTHLATGRETLDHGFVRSDVFTWTSAGESLVVQSWLASALYGVVDAVAGFWGLRVLMAATAGLLGGLVWRLSGRAESLITRLVVTIPVFYIGVTTWTERPLLLAFCCFLATLVIVEEERDVRWLLLIGFVWINVHGSWPLGVVLVGARWLGAIVGRRRGDGAAQAATDWTAAWWLAAGIVAGGMLNPYGPRLLTFPIELLGRREVLQHVSEWKPSSYGSLWSQLFLVLVAAGVLSVRRAPWRLIVPALVFVVAALLSARNITLATFVLVPLLSAGLSQIPGVDPNRRSDAIRLATTALASLAVIVPLVAIRGPHVDLDRYPIEAVNAMVDDLDLSPADRRVVHQDFVGNYFDLRFGDAGATWIDDRFELHDLELVEDYLVLLDATPGWDEVLRRHDPDALLWPADKPLVEVALADGWTEVWGSDDWVVLVPPGRG
ncbi:MAG: hypothetical protein AAF081_13905 [Actinomycetota bacterium]